MRLQLGRCGLNYQYRAFGVPGLGLKRGLAQDLVVAPYASALALMVAPEEACLNLQRLAADGLAGRFGLYEAIDYTPARLPRGQASAVVRSFMAHHQGMILLSLAHVLLGRPIAEAIRVESAVQGNPSVAAGAHSKDRGTLFAPCRAFRDSWDFGRSGGAGTRNRKSRHADTGSAAVVERQIPRHGHERGRREQPMEGPRRHPLARRQHLRQLGHVLLHPRRGERGLLVDRAPADGEARSALRSHIHRSARRISPARQRPRIAYRDRRIAGRRHRAAPAPHHQPLADAADDRGHELRGSRSRVACRGRAASGVFQSLRADGDHPAAASHPVHPSAPLARRAAALDVSPDGRPRAGFAGRFLRDRPHGVHRPRTHGRRSAGDDRCRKAVRSARARSWIRSSRSGIG